MVVQRLCDVQGGGYNFWRAFWCIGPCVESFHKSCRSFVSVDGTRLMGKYRGQFLIATTLDGNDRLYPLAYAVVETENYHNWMWFLCLLKRHVLTKPGAAMYSLDCIMSDRMKGLIKAVKHGLPNTKHSFCMKHLESNFKSRYSDDAYLISLFWKAATTYREMEFEQAIAQMHAHNPKVASFWVKAPAECWSSAKFPGKRYGQLTTSISESFNNVMKGARGKAITNLAEHTRMKATEWANNRRASCAAWITPITPAALEILLRNRENSRQHNVFSVDAHIYQVNSPAFQDVVDLDKRTCSCRTFQDIGIPCEHACVAIDAAGLDCHDFIEKWWLTETYKETYAKPIMPTLDRSQWDKSGPPTPYILPPEYKRGPGRPEERRRENMPARKRKMTCTNCTMVGHNRRKCPNRGVCTSSNPQPTSNVPPFIS